MATDPAGRSPYAHQQPFPGAVPVSGPGPAMTPQARPVVLPRVVMDIPPTLPRPTFLLRTDGKFSEEAARLFTEWNDRITQYLGTAPDANNGASLVRPRCSLLSDACQRKDIVYIVMHHRFCLWSRHRQTAHVLMRPYLPELVDSGFTALEVLLKANVEMPMPHLDWFCTFPGRTFDPYLPTPMMESIAKSIMEFITTLAANWRQFQASIVTRGYPILTWEAELGLKCVSSVTQDLLFTLSRRVLGCQDSQTANKFAELFNRDRNFEATVRMRQLPADQVQHVRNVLVRDYTELVRQSYAVSSNLHQPPQVLTSQGRSPAIPTQQPGNAFARPSNNMYRSGTEPGRNISWPPQSAATGVATANPVMEQTRRMIPSNSPTAPAVAAHQLLTSSPAQPIIQQVAMPTDSKLPARTSHMQATAFSPAAVQQVTTPIRNKQLTNPGSSSAAAVHQPLTPALALLPADAPPDRGQLRLIPETEFPHSAYGEASLRVGLHLALQRSPKRIHINRVAPVAKFYQFVDSLVVHPTKLTASPHPIQINFQVSENDVQNLPVQEISSTAFGVPTVTFQNYTCRFRLRACRFTSRVTKVNESEWAATNSFWPQSLVIAVNSKPCILRRKQHFHADLPLELSAYVKAGRNEIALSLPGLVGKEIGSDYFVAVERVTTLNYVSLRAKINGNPHITAEATRNAFKHILESGCSNEIVVLGRTLNVSVSDPLSTKLCDIPVIGASCKHMDCFDLENWLRSRRSKPGADSQEPCLVDCWGCPICGGDARPGQLRINDYFVEVGRRLREAANTDVKTVAVGPDGNWEPLIDEPGRRQPGKPLEPGDRRQQNIEVIEILDD